MSYFSCDQFLQRQIFVFLLIYTKLVMKQQWIPAHTTMVMKSVHLKFCNGWRASLHCLFFIFFNGKNSLWSSASESQFIQGCVPNVVVI